MAPELSREKHIQRSRDRGMAGGWEPAGVGLRLELRRGPVPLLYLSLNLDLSLAAKPRPTCNLKWVGW
jgi:hypothetical protein